MKKLIYKLSLGLALLLPMSACTDTDFLEEANPNELSTDNFWKSIPDLEMGMVSVYNTFKDRSILSTVEENHRSDLTYPGWGRPNTKDIYYLQTFNSASGAPNNKWQALYKGIFRANQVIEAYERLAPTLTSETEQESANLILAQARFFRGLFHFYLHSSFNKGSIIIFDFVPKEEKDFYQKLQSEDKVREFFLADLQFAYENLPAKWDDKDLGRVTAGAAAAVIGKSYLYQKDYANASVYFKDVIDNYGYALTDNIGDNFSSQTEFNSESILEIAHSLNYKSEENPGAEEQVSTNLAFLLSPVGGYRSVLPSLWLIDAYRHEEMDENDPRNYFQDEDGNDILKPYSLRASYSLAFIDDSLSYYQAPPYHRAKFNNKETAYYRKYTNWETGTTELDINPTQRSGINIRVIRLADIYLMYAEILIEGGTNEAGVAEALMYINKVRHRSALKMIGLSSGGEFSGQYDEQVYSAEQVMDHLMYVERPLELSLEGHAIRHLDMRRWGITKERFQTLSLEIYHGVDFPFIDEDGKKVTRWSSVLERGEHPVNSAQDLFDYREAAINFIPDVHGYWPLPNSEAISNPNIN
ncbi:RagB/SusD family nutrient uptake outer membrane protein [Limibacter armeniacum]|uniref:RagB/SusD family nutrient uptake outer membrane protein n=1 Tax=Limibacter armeniacum TaxID=466084 RepID=UPI002FE641FE